MVTLLLALSTVILPQQPRIRGVGVVYKFIKQTTIPGVDLGLNQRANIFGASDESDALQDKRLKNNHPLGVPFPSSYAVKIH